MSKFQIEIFFLDEYGNPGSLEYDREAAALAELLPHIYLEVEEWHNTTDMEVTSIDIRYDNVTVLQLSMHDLLRYINSIHVEVTERLERHQVCAVMLLGSREYDLQLADCLNKLADVYLAEFNLPDQELQLRLPAGARNLEDEKRKLQYLVEFCKIAAFQLRGHPANSW